MGKKINKCRQIQHIQTISDEQWVFLQSWRTVSVPSGNSLVKLSSSHFWPGIRASQKPPPRNLTERCYQPEVSTEYCKISNYSGLQKKQWMGHLSSLHFWHWPSQVTVLSSTRVRPRGGRPLFDTLCCVFHVAGLGRADWITSQDTGLSAAEGGSVSLHCRYSSSSTDYVILYWFRQHPNKAPEYILHRGWGNPEKGVADFALERFYSKSTAHSIDLQIKTLIPADTALYFCALASTKIASHRAATQKPQAEGMAHAHM